MATLNTDHNLAQEITKDEVNSATVYVDSEAIEEIVQGAPTITEALGNVADYIETVQKNANLKAVLDQYDLDSDEGLNQLLVDLGNAQCATSTSSLSSDFWHFNWLLGKAANAQAVAVVGTSGCTVGVVVCTAGAGAATLVALAYNYSQMTPAQKEMFWKASRQIYLNGGFGLGTLSTVIMLTGGLEDEIPSDIQQMADSEGSNGDDHPKQTVDSGGTADPGCDPENVEQCQNEYNTAKDNNNQITKQQKDAVKMERSPTHQMKNCVEYMNSYLESKIKTLEELRENSYARWRRDLVQIQSITSKQWKERTNCRNSFKIISKI